MCEFNKFSGDGQMLLYVNESDVVNILNEEKERLIIIAFQLLSGLIIYCALTFANLVWAGVRAAGRILIRRVS